MKIFQSNPIQSNRSLSFLSVGLLIFTTLTSASVQASVIDYPSGGQYSQSIAANVPSSGNAWIGIAQSFTAEDSNIKFGFYGFDFSASSDQVLLSLYSGDGNFSNLLGQQLVSISPGLPYRDVFIEADFSSITLGVGSSYTVAATLPSQALPNSGTYSNASLNYNSNSNSYPGGRFYFLGSSYDQNQPVFSNRELAFKVTPAAVPVPGAFWLFTSALAGFRFLGRRNTK